MPTRVDFKTAYALYRTTKDIGKVLEWLSRQQDSGMGYQSNKNNSTTTLGSGGTFTGESELNPDPDVMCSCFSDTDGTLYFDFSVNGTDWRTFPSSGFSVSAGIHEFHTAVKGPRYFRVRFVNGTTAQSTFQLYTYFGEYRAPNSPVNQTIGLDSDSTLVRTMDFQDEVRRGKRTGIIGWTKFAYRSGLTAANGEETVWATTGNYTVPTSASTMTISYDGTGGGSTDGAGTNGANALTIYYIDENGLPQTLTHTLGTDGSDVTTAQTLGINRVAVSASGSGDCNASDITITATTGGAKLAFIPSQQSVTQQAIYHVGSNHDAVAKFLYLHVNKPSGGNAKVQIKAYAHNRGVDTRYEVFRTTIDTTSQTTQTIIEPIGFNLSPTDVLYFVADTDTSNAEVVVRFSLNEYQRT